MSKKETEEKSFTFYKTDKNKEVVVVEKTEFEKIKEFLDLKKYMFVDNPRTIREQAEAEKHFGNLFEKIPFAQDKPEFNLKEGPGKRVQPFIVFAILGVIVFYTFFLLSSGYWPNDNIAKVVIPIFGTALFTLVATGIVGGLEAAFIYIVNGQTNHYGPADDILKIIHGWILYPISSIAALFRLKKEKKKYKEYLIKLEQRGNRISAKKKQIFDLHDVAFGEYGKEAFEDISFETVKEIIEK